MYTRRNFGPRPGSVASSELASTLTGSFSAESRASQDNGKLRFQQFCSTERHGSNIGFKFSPVLTATDTAMRVRTTPVRAWTLLTRVYCVHAACAGVPGLCILVLETPHLRFSTFSQLAAAAVVLLYR